MVSGYGCNYKVNFNIYDLRQELISTFSLITIIGSLNQRRENNGLSIGSRSMRNTKQRPRNPFLVLFDDLMSRSIHYYINSVGTSSYQHFVKYVNWYNSHI